MNFSKNEYLKVPKVNKIQKIPKIIHHTWKDKNSVPQMLQQHRMINVVNNINYDIIFWDDQEMYEFVENEEKEVRDRFMNLPHKIMQVDIFRYLLMRKYGGIYMDMDFLLSKNLDEVVGDSDLVLPEEIPEGENKNLPGMPTIGQFFLASTRNHPYWDDVISRCLLKKPEVYGSDWDLVLLHSGQGVITKTFFDENKYSGSLIPFGTFGRHEYVGSWVDDVCKGKDGLSDSAKEWYLSWGIKI